MQSEVVGFMHHCQSAPGETMQALPGGPVNGLFMPYRTRSGIQQQPGIGTFCKKGSVRTLQVSAGEEIDRSGGGGDVFFYKI